MAGAVAAAPPVKVRALGHRDELARVQRQLVRTARHKVKEHERVLLGRRVMRLLPACQRPSCRAPGRPAAHRPPRPHRRVCVRQAHQLHVPILLIFIILLVRVLFVILILIVVIVIRGG